jgi:hypothetical protein
MINLAHRHKLQQAYLLIKQRQFSAARPLVNSVLQEDQDNLNAWWLASYTSQEPAEIRRALGQVLRLQVQHGPAQERLRRLEERHRALPTTKHPGTEIRLKKSLDQVREAPRRKPIRWNVLVFRLAAFLCFWGMSFMVVDAFLGGNFSQPLEQALGIQPEVLGWVNVRGGMGNESLPEEQRIPIVLDETLEDYDEMKVNVLRQGEAHVYRFGATQGTEVIIASNFSNGGLSEVNAVELWDANGNLIEGEQDFSDLTSQIESRQDEFLASIVAVRGIVYTIPRTGNYQVALISREGGPSGQYSFFFTNTTQSIGTFDQYADPYR